MARANFDYVVIDMPSTVVQWTETVLNAAHVYFAPLELDMRSAQNTLRMIRALKAEDLPYDKLRYVLNRAPKFTDLSGKSRVKRLAESLDIDDRAAVARRRQAGGAGQRPRPAAGRDGAEDAAAQGNPQARQLAARASTSPREAAS